MSDKCHSNPSTWYDFPFKHRSGVAFNTPKFHCNELHENEGLHEPFLEWMMSKLIYELHMTLVLHLFSNSHKVMRTMRLVKSNMSRPWNRFYNWTMVRCLQQLFYFVVAGWKMGLTTKATPLINEMRQVFYLQIFIACYMNSMNPWFSLHKFSRCFFGVSQRHLGGRLYWGRSLEVDELLHTHMMITLRPMVLCLG